MKDTNEMEILFDSRSEGFNLLSMLTKVFLFPL